MDDVALDRQLIGAAFAMAAREGWAAVTVAAAAQAAGVPLDAARLRAPNRDALLLRFGRLLDAAALAEIPEDGTARERLFDLVMRRFDAMQPYRTGIAALLRALPAHPGTALLLAAATAGSMAWLLDAASIPSTGLRGAVRVQALTVVWMQVLRRWEADDTPDLAGTMAALDRALDRAERFAPWLGTSAAVVAPPPFPEVPETDAVGAV